jgi:hypothetical protein
MASLGRLQWPLVQHTERKVHYGRSVQEVPGLSTAVSESE